MPDTRRLTARLSRRAVIQELAGATAAASPPATGPPVRAETWSARGTRNASGATAVAVLAADGPSRTKIVPWRGNGSAPEASGRLSFRSARKSASWSLVSMSEARWLLSWGMADGGASRSAGRRTSSARRAAARAGRAGVGGGGEPVVGEGDLAVDLGPGVLQDLADPVAHAAVDLVGVDQHHRPALGRALDQLGEHGGAEALQPGLLLLEGDVLAAIALALG